MNQNLPTIINGTIGDDTLEGTSGIDLLLGFDGNDLLQGNEGHDFLFGGLGNDTLYGGTGHDYLLGGTGDDSLYGGDGSDILLGGEGNDRLYGGAGTDIFDGGEGWDIVYFQENFAITADLSQGRATYTNDVGVEVVETLIDIETVVGNALDDLLIGDAAKNTLWGQQGNDTLIGGAGNDGLFGGAGIDFFDGGEGHDIVYFRENFAITADLNQDRATYTNDAGVEIVETLISIESLGGTALNDLLIGDAGKNNLYGLEGNDTLIGNAGNDVLRGDAGEDILDGGSGIDTASFYKLQAGVTADLNQGTAISINQAGELEVDTLIDIERLGGTDFDDQLIGDEGNNRLYGEDGNDTLIGGEGDDVLSGSAGVDFFDGGEGRDTVYFNENFAITADLNQGRATYINDAGVEIVETLIDIERLVGTAFDDQFIGDEENNALYGQEGNDTLIGGEGDDVLYGGAGVDFLDGGEGNDWLRGGIGIDFFDGGEGIDTADFITEEFAITGNLNTETATYTDAVGNTIVEIMRSIESLRGTHFNDLLIGNAENNSLVGNDGNDTLVGGNGNDWLRGDAGIDFLDGGEGRDTADFKTGEFAIIGDLNTQTTTYTDAVGNTIVETFRNIENLQGTSFDDLLLGNAQDNSLLGSHGNDTLLGDEGDDWLRGGAGIDFLDGGEGIDTADFSTEEFAITADLNAETATYTDALGNTIIETMSNMEKLRGTNFDDLLIGNAENNTLNGSNGNDTLLANDGNDILVGDLGEDIIDGGNGIDIAYFYYLESGVTADLNQGTATSINQASELEVDTLVNIEDLTGTAFDDQLIGNAENNTLKGVDGNDYLLGAAGNDYLQGGAGADTFVFLSPNQGIDTIADFNLIQGDLIQISATGFGGGLTVGTLDVDQFTIGSAATNASDRIIYNDATGALFFDSDGTGAIGQVQFAQLSTGLALTNSDIFVV
ncbi:MAG: calcium-binding protein [Symploca sp. SIO2C1]|nr:calcium-binding protein [Symploca sp. SIO2C1]